MARVALVVGINRYQHFHDLSVPAKDAEAIAQRLQADGEFKVIRLPEALLKTGSRRFRATVSESSGVTQAQLETALKDLFKPNSSQLPDTALFYFSGHGLPDPEGSEGLDKGYLATSDTDPRQTRPGLSLAWLQNLLVHSPIPNQLVWLDCCHSGGLLIDVQAANPGQSNNHNRCFIASSRDFEQSWQDLNSPYSVLTKALLEGLDPQRLPGRWVDTFAVVDYVNQALQGELQTATCTNFGDAINLTRTWQSANPTAPTATTSSEVCPYKGLEFFDWNEEDAQYFYGREALTDQLLDQVRTQNFMALVGASGNGKSSVLRAGLLYQLQLGRRIAGSNQWQILLMRPDDQPMQHLAEVFLPPDGSQLDRAEALGRAVGLLQAGGAGLARLIQASTAPRVVLVVDQFEEVFTRCEDGAERGHFLACLMEALATVGDKLCLIIAMRSDFVGKCLERDYSGLAQRVEAAMVSVLPMQPEEPRAAICQPAMQVGLTVEDALVTEILDDIHGAPGSLPLLQYTLKELWQQRQNHQLVLSAYQRLGGINGTLDQRATELYERFDAAQQRTVQHIFQQLTQLGEGTEDTRRRVFLDNLISAPQHPAERVKTVIEILSAPENRLLVTSEVVSKGDRAERRAIVDVAHEALIRHWRLLRQWLEQNRDLLRQQRRIETSTLTWQEHHQAKGYLLQGLALDEAIQFQKQQADAFPLSDPARTYIQKSRRQRLKNRLQTASWLLIPAALVVGVVEHNLREESVKANYVRLDSSSKQEERAAVEDLVKGCWVRGWVPSYLAERLFGNCRSLSTAPLEEADLRFSNLSSAHLREADLTFANLSNADLSNADLSSAHLSHVYLTFANLSSADLFGANLSNVVLSHADLSHVYLTFANLSSADLFGANLSNVVLSHADLSHTDLSHTDLSEADIFGADLRNANLRNANLRNANLSDANLSDANLSDANLSNAMLLASDLRSTHNLTAQQLTGESAPLLCNSPLPPDIARTISKDRDCDALVEMTTGHIFPFYLPEEAQDYIEKARTKTWE